MLVKPARLYVSHPILEEYSEVMARCDDKDTFLYQASAVIISAVHVNHGRF
jgi:hypothetical protein